MKINLFMLAKQWSIILFFFFSVGCVSQIASFEDSTKGWIGRPLVELKAIISRPTSYASRIGWKEKTYRLDNGNLVYVEPDGKGCFIHWEVNPQGIIIGYRTEGGRCY